MPLTFGNVIYSPDKIKLMAIIPAPECKLFYLSSKLSAIVRSHACSSLEDLTGLLDFKSEAQK